MGGDPAALDLAVHRDAHGIWPFVAVGAGGNAVLVDLEDTLCRRLVRGVHVQIPQPAAILVVFGEFVAALRSGDHGGQVVNAQLNVPVGRRGDLILPVLQLTARRGLLAGVGLLPGGGQLQRPPGGIQQRDRQLHHGQHDIHAVGLGKAVDTVALGKGVVALPQLREIRRRQGQGHGLKLCTGQPLLGLRFQVRGQGHIVPGMGRPHPAELIDRILRKDIVFTVVDAGDVHPLFEGVDPGFAFQRRAQRNERRRHVLGGGGLAVIQQVQPELNGLGAVAAVLLDADPVQIKQAVFVPQTQIAAEPVHQLVPDDLQRVFVVGIAVQAVVGVGDRDLPDLYPLALFHLAVVDIQQGLQQRIRGQIVIFRLRLDAVCEKAQSARAVDLLIPVPVDLRDLPHLAVKNLRVVSEHGEHGSSTEDFIV